MFNRLVFTLLKFCNLYQFDMIWANVYHNFSIKMYLGGLKFSYLSKIPTKVNKKMVLSQRDELLFKTFSLLTSLRVIDH